MEISYDENTVRIGLFRELPPLEKASKTTDAPKIEVAQTLWTCAVQAMSEYCRIVWDIFGNERSVLFFVGDYNRTPKE